MIARSGKDSRQFTSETYRLTLLEDRPFVRVESAQGDLLAELFLLSSVHSLQGRDDTTEIGAWRVDEQPDVTTFQLRVQSSLWKTKLYRIRCFPHRFLYDVKIEGEGQLAEVNYFGGYYSGQPRWGSGFFWSGHRFLSMFNAEPNTAENNYFPPESNATIDLMGVPLPGRDDWFFTPPPFCFAMQSQEGWLALGVETSSGQNRFTEYRYHGKPSAFYLSLAYDGQTSVNGSYQLPAIGFDFASDEYTALEKHIKALSALQPSSTRISEMEQPKPAWWHTPIFCGWGAQCYLASSQGGRAPDYARQDVYENFLQTLEAEDVDPSIVVLDDKWQLTYGENGVDESKWHNLPGFIAGQHARGRKVLLWLKAWDPEGLPTEECITNAAGLPIACDPSNPAYEHRLRATVQRMISPNGYDADGFKIDFTARIPAGPGLNIHGDSWGLELMRHYFSILHSEAKRIKPDALIMTHTPHPYLQDVVDMIRLNDINGGRDVNESMAHRARVAAIACPQLSIDTDDWPMPNKAAWRAYTRLQPELGVPSLYYVTHIDSTGEALDTEDYSLIRESWAQYRRKTEVHQGEKAKNVSVPSYGAGEE
ncbi:MAG TPA: hypothetical protein VJ830_01575 [Anaerolineales bacterium]|nr:hypothetical protein [Anaerolineales bacterium]